MSKKYLLICGLAMITLANCKKPEACIQPSPSTAKLGQPVTFTNCSENSEYYTYSFGDGTQSFDEKEPVHSYKTPGEYIASVEVKNKKKKKDATAEATVTVSDFTTSEVTGSWLLYKLDDGMTPTSPNQKYEFTADTVKIYGSGNSAIYTTDIWHKPDVGEIAIGAFIYKVIRIYDNELHLTQGSNSQYMFPQNKYYFRKL